MNARSYEIVDTSGDTVKYHRRNRNRSDNSKKRTQEWLEGYNSRPEASRYHPDIIISEYIMFFFEHTRLKPNDFGVNITISISIITISICHEYLMHIHDVHPYTTLIFQFAHRTNLPVILQHNENLNMQMNFRTVTKSVINSFGGLCLRKFL